MTSRSDNYRRVPFFLCLSILVMASACRQGNLPKGNVKITRDGESLAAFEVELAQNAEDQARGLMNRESLPEDEGMAFLFDAPAGGPFHMLDTLIPLDIAFWDENNEIIDIQTMTPCTGDPCEQFYPPSLYVGALEVNAGALAAQGVTPGDVVELEKD